MTCTETEILLHALLDGELDAGHAREVEVHVAHCPHCGAQMRAYRELQQAMPAAQLRFTAPASLRRRIEKAFPAAPQSQCGLKDRQKRSFAVEKRATPLRIPIQAAIHATSPLASTSARSAVQFPFRRFLLHGRASDDGLSRRPKNLGPFQREPVMAKATLDRLR